MSRSKAFDTSYSQDEAFWNDYVSRRPTPPDSFFDRIYLYHASHGGNFNSVHECGAGIGIHSARLAARFNHVLVTDASRQNIDLAQRRLGDSQKYSCKVTKLEDSGSTIPPASIDLIFASVMLHFVSPIDAAMEAIARQLKSGGTLAIAVYAVPALYNPKVQDVCYRLYHRWWKETFVGADGSIKGHTGSLMVASGYDSLPIPCEHFLNGTKRIKTNEIPGWSWLRAVIPPEWDEAATWHSEISALDELIYDRDTGWDFEADFPWLKAVISTFPGFEREDCYIDLWTEMEQLIGEGKVKGTFPVVTILSTRK